MDDQRILDMISALIAEEHALLSRGEDEPLTEEEHRRLKLIEVALDQAWDLLRQRRARRSAGLDPEEAAIRPASVVENYEQ